MARGRRQVGLVPGEDRELVAAETGDEVVMAHEAADPLGDRDEERVAGGVAEGVVDDLEVVEVDEEDGRDPVALGAPRHAPQGPLEGELEHAPVGGAGQRVTLGQVLDVPQQDRIPQVERGDGRELAQDRCDPALDPEHGPRAMLDDDRADRASVGEHRRDEQVARARQSSRTGVGSPPGSSRLTGSEVAALPRLRDDRVRGGRAPTALR